jgi:hypothetical protein
MMEIATAERRSGGSQAFAPLVHAEVTSRRLSVVEFLK